MSQSQVEQIVGKMVLDPTFRSRVKADPDGALAGSGLNSDEIATLRNLSEADLDATFSGLDQRISKRHSFRR